MQTTSQILYTFFNDSSAEDASLVNGTSDRSLQ